MKERPVAIDKTVSDSHPLSDAGGRQPQKEAVFQGRESRCPIDAIPMAFIEVDLKEVCIARVNRLFCGLSGFSESELMEMKDLRGLFDIDDNSLHLFLDKAVHEGTCCTTLPVVVHGKIQGRISCSAKLQAIVEGQKPQSLIGLLSDPPPWRREDMERLHFKGGRAGQQGCRGHGLRRRQTLLP